MARLNQVIIIGAGAAGLAAAGTLKQRGISSLLVEAGVENPSDNVAEMGSQPH